MGLARTHLTRRQYGIMVESMALESDFWGLNHSCVTLGRFLSLYKTYPMPEEQEFINIIWTQVS